MSVGERSTEADANDLTEESTGYYTSALTPALSHPMGEGASRLSMRSQITHGGHVDYEADCGFSPFSDDTFTGQDMAFAKIRVRVDGTRIAAEILGAHP